MIEQVSPKLMGRAARLARLVRRLKPDIVHSLEMQSAGCLTLEAKRLLGDTFPPWIVTNWGSDIHLFGRLVAHVDRIKAVLSACDYYACECRRDVVLAQEYGFKGQVLPVLPTSGGYDLARARLMRQPGPSSARRIILLNGHQGWAGRALVGLRAIELCAVVLQEYRIVLYRAGEDVRLAAELAAHSTGLPIDVIPCCSDDELLQWHGRARMSIGLSMSDAISTSLLEAITMGSFPIQSNTSCADEWVKNGKTGMLVHPEDPEAVAAAIRRAVSDDALVDDAAEINAELAAERLDCSLIRSQAIAMYEKVTTETQMKTGAHPNHRSGRA
jgi:glycosyltransferase involved in cell wall biosynthesis